MFIDFHIEIFPNGRPEGDTYDIAKRIVEEKGVNTSEVDLDYLLNLKKEYEDEVTTYLNENETAKELGVTTFKQLQESVMSKAETDEDENDIKLAKLHSYIMYEEGVDSFWRLQAVDQFIDRYNYSMRSDNYSNLSEKQIDRINTIKSSREYRDVLPKFIFSNYNAFIFNSLILIIISIIFLLAPIFINDKHKNLEQIQYTTKRGRKLYKDKIITALIASIIIVTVELGILFFLYLTRENTLEIFYNASINSWLSIGGYWFDLTFKEYIFVSIAVVYLFSLSLSLIISFISRICSRYITLIGICLLLTIGLVSLVTQEFLVGQGIGFIYKPKFLVLVFLIIMATLGGLLVFIRNKKEKNRSIAT